MDYTAVKTPEIRFTQGNTQIRDSDSIDVMTLTDGNDDELEETFYLNFNPTRNAIFIPPRIEIKICGSKHKFYLKTILQIKIHIAYLYCMLLGRFNCNPLPALKQWITTCSLCLAFVQHNNNLGNGEVDLEVCNLPIRTPEMRTLR